nr:immunoglobulin heavy chain junction region [Mus musculus]
CARRGWERYFDHW